ncbi:MAG: hypothetical protein PHN49_04105, partial [Candidatus Omnitrophica bacterium]|nr:hypothetical protein [Candidatus Omnitrophota bacterium]
NAGVLIHGPQNSGKSTLALLLAQNGFEYFSDDDCFIQGKGGRPYVFSLPTKIGVSRTLLKKYPAFRHLTVKNYTYGGKQRMPMGAMTVDPDRKKILCKLILFPRYRAHGRLQIKKISQRESFERLIGLNRRNVPSPGFQKEFWTFFHLTKNAVSYELIYHDGHLKALPGIISQYLP